MQPLINRTAAVDPSAEARGADFEGAVEEAAKEAGDVEEAEASSITVMQVWTFKGDTREILIKSCCSKNSRVQSYGRSAIAQHTKAPAYFDCFFFPMRQKECFVCKSKWNDCFHRYCEKSPYVDL